MVTTVTAGAQHDRFILTTVGAIFGFSSILAAFSPTLRVVVHDAPSQLSTRIDVT